MDKSIIVLNDLRATPIISAIKLKNSFKNNIFIAHDSIFTNNEYADYSNNLWKFFLKIILKFFFGLVIIKPIEKKLRDDEKLGFFSSLISITKDSYAKETDYPKIATQIHNLTLGSKDIVRFLINISPDNVFVFNGRTASSYLITKYCVHKKINLFFYEFAGHLNGFRLFPVPPHAARKLGEFNLNYFRYGIYNSLNLYNASKTFIYQKLNSNYRKLSDNKIGQTFDVAIFLGSDYEYTAVDPEICDVEWKGNLNFCINVINEFGLDKKYVIKCHPNSINDPNWDLVSNELSTGLTKLGIVFEIINPDSNIDSYSLISSAKILVTDFSTIALDFILMGKKTKIFGNTDIKYIYQNKWFQNYSNEFISQTIMLPFALTHNFFVFRFSIKEKVSAYFLFLFQRSFEKFYS